jgi:hypothetical protein
LGDCLLGEVFLKITEEAQVHGLLFSTIKIMNHFSQKMGWATTCANFSLTRLVTLLPIVASVLSFSFLRISVALSMYVSRAPHGAMSNHGCQSA